MNVYCEICGSEMEYKKRDFSPGHNEPCLIIKPCCIPEENQARIDYVNDDLLQEIQDGILDLTENIENFMELIKDENYFHDSKEQRQDITDYCVTLKSCIKKLITDGII